MNNEIRNDKATAIPGDWRAARPGLHAAMAAGDVSNDIQLWIITGRMSPAWIGMIPTKSAWVGEEKLTHYGIRTSASRRVLKRLKDSAMSLLGSID